mgnify:FL=1
MKKLFRQNKFILILVPLGLFIVFINKKLNTGFLSSSKIENHYIFVGLLLLIVFILLFIILRIDKKS